MAALEIVTIRPKEGVLARLKEIRPTMLAEYARRFPEVTAHLFEQEDGTLLDIWEWPDRATAQAALDDPTVSPTFTGEWRALVDVVSFKWAEPARW
ncbi:hypothetical protein [Actinomadura rubrisoli]|uniref:ABM domain-containing protein n=1 Tax=Actinomadura rubrisoli TaxID=2530368 RepID=A0A4R5BC84_9ACTN|nr:hypothetical protein [Actinomadura rubrisoli]TDD82853.1 hypothetical protein E1298_22120 [Actinomadura rubrisoli]